MLPGALSRYPGCPLCPFGKEGSDSGEGVDDTSYHENDIVNEVDDEAIQSVRIVDLAAELAHVRFARFLSPGVRRLGSILGIRRLGSILGIRRFRGVLGQALRKGAAAVQIPGDPGQGHCRKQNAEEQDGNADRKVLLHSGTLPLFLAGAADPEYRAGEKPPCSSLRQSRAFSISYHAPGNMST